MSTETKIQSVSTTDNFVLRIKDDFRGVRGYDDIVHYVGAACDCIRKGEVRAGFAHSKSDSSSTVLGWPGVECAKGSLLDLLRFSLRLTQERLIEIESWQTISLLFVPTEVVRVAGIGCFENGATQLCDDGADVASAAIVTKALLAAYEQLLKKHVLGKFKKIIAHCHRSNIVQHGVVLYKDATLQTLVGKAPLLNDLVDKFKAELSRDL